MILKRKYFFVENIRAVSCLKMEVVFIVLAAVISSFFWWITFININPVSFAASTSLVAKHRDHVWEVIRTAEPLHWYIEQGHSDDSRADENNRGKVFLPTTSTLPSPLPTPRTPPSALVLSVYGCLYWLLYVLLILLVIFCAVLFVFIFCKKRSKTFSVHGVCYVSSGC